MVIWQQQTGYSLLEVTPHNTKYIDAKVTFIQDVHSEDTTTIHIEVTLDNIGCRSPSKSPDKSPTSRRPRDASRSASRHKDMCFSYRQFNHFAKQSEGYLFR